MTLCPIAIVAGCKKCPAFGICPLKGVLGDQGAAQPTGNKETGAKPKGGSQPRK